MEGWKYDLCFDLKWLDLFFSYVVVGMLLNILKVIYYEYRIKIWEFIKMNNLNRSMTINTTHQL